MDPTNLIAIPKETLSRLESQMATLKERVQYLEDREKSRNELVESLETKNLDMEERLRTCENATSRLTSIDLAIRALDAKQNELSEAVKKVQRPARKELDSLKKELRQDLDSLNKQCQDMKLSCDQIDRLTTLQRVLNQLQTRAIERHTLAAEVESFKKSVASVKERIALKSNSHFAFSAGKRFAKPLELNPSDQWVKMDDCDCVLVSCPAFRQSDVIFTASMHGTYAFYAELWQDGSGQLEAALRSLRGIKYFFGKTSGNGTQCCGVAITNLAARESVWVVAKRCSGMAKVKEYWFSGWLIA